MAASGDCILAHIDQPMTDNIAIAFKNIKIDSGHERNSLRAFSFSTPLFQLIRGNSSARGGHKH
jgi:hypothetical protein